MNWDSINSVSEKYGIDLSGNEINIDKGLAGVRGTTASDQTITLGRGAFENEEQLAKTLVHEQFHVGQLEAAYRDSWRTACMVRPMATAWPRRGGLLVSSERQLPAELIAEARAKPGGWVYEVVGEYGLDDPVPPTAIRGAWKVNDDGEIVGDFLPNPLYEPPKDA